MKCTERTVTTQDELDQALADGVDFIDINSPVGVWIRISDTGSASVSASGSASVRAYDSASVRAYDSASVRAYDSASVRASDSASVSAYDSASVRAYGSASVSAYGCVSVHLHSKRVKVDGGVLIDVTDLDYSDPVAWCEQRGVEVVDGIAYLFKAVDEKWTTDRGFDYSPGSTVEAPDWDPKPICGFGLHACAHPLDALRYHDGPKFVRFGVPVDSLVPIVETSWNGVPTSDKVKFPRITEACVEVDVHGRQVVPA